MPIHAKAVVCGAAAAGLLYAIWPRRKRNVYYNIVVNVGRPNGPPAGVDEITWIKEKLQLAFDQKDEGGYLYYLGLAVKFKLPPTDIPRVYMLKKDTTSFNQISEVKSSLTVELCFILDYTGSMGEQMKQAKDAVGKIIEHVKTLKIKSMPACKIDLKVAAVAYNDWDEKTKERGRPVVSVYGGDFINELPAGKTQANGGTDLFKLGGKFTSETDDLQTWMDQPLGHGGKVPEELTGALIATAELEWSAEYRMAIVITDAPCHGHQYSDKPHDEFCLPESGLTCAGKPLAPIQKMMKKKVDFVVLHTGLIKQCLIQFKNHCHHMIEAQVDPKETCAHMVKLLNDKLVDLRPLSYSFEQLEPADEDSHFDHAAGCEVSIKTSEMDKQTYTTDRDGLIWVGVQESDGGYGAAKPSQVMIKRPVTEELANWKTETSWQPLPAIAQFGATFEFPNIPCQMPTTDSR